MIDRARVQAAVALSWSEAALRKLVNDITVATVFVCDSSERSLTINAILKLHIALNALARKSSGVRLLSNRCFKMAPF